MTAIPIRRLNHAVLFVSEVQRAATFWSSAFDMEIAAEVSQANAVFLRLRGQSNHHDLGLFGLGPDVTKAPGAGIGLYHLAWQVDTIDDLVAARQTLADLGALRGESSHGATKSLYGADPDGNEFEVMWMLPRKDWGEFEHQATVEPLDLEGELGRWTGISTADEIDEH